MVQNFVKKLVFILLTITGTSSLFAQEVGIIKTGAGYLCFKNGDDLVFTIPIDSTNPTTPYWAKENELIIIPGIIHLRYFNESDISTKSKKPRTLKDLQDHDIAYIKSEHPHYIKITNDTLNFEFNSIKEINKWYYFTKNSDSNSLIHYIVDIKKNEYFIRLEINVNDDIDFARRAAYYTLENFKFYEKKMVIKNVQREVKNGTNY